MRRTAGSRWSRHIIKATAGANPIGTPANQGHNETTSGTTLAVTTLANIPAGNQILIFHNATATNVPITSVVDPSSNVYISVFSNNVTNPILEVFVATAASLISLGATITVNFGGPVGRHGITIWSCSGLAAAPFGGATSVFRGTAATSGTLTFPAPLSQANNLLVTLFGSGVAPGTMTFDTGYTALGGGTSASWCLPAYKSISSGFGGTDTTSWVNSIVCGCVGIALKGSS